MKLKVNWPPSRPKVCRTGVDGPTVFPFHDQAVCKKAHHWHSAASVPPHPDPLPWGEGARLGRLTAQLAARRVHGFTAGTFSGNSLPGGRVKGEQSVRGPTRVPTDTSSALTV